MSTFKRLIPVVLLRNGYVVQSKGFKRWQMLGNPSTVVSRLSNWTADELIYLDITREGAHDLRRDDPVSWAREAAERGAGEVLLGSIDHDGTAQGYDLALISEVAGAVRIPVIALGGVGEWAHLGAGLDAGASAVAAGNIFHYSENSVVHAARWLFENGYGVRRPALTSLAREGDL